MCFTNDYKRKIKDSSDSANNLNSVELMVLEQLIEFAPLPDF